MGKNNKNIINFADKTGRRLPSGIPTGAYISNPDLVKLMNNFKAETSLQNWTEIINHLFDVRVLVPANFNEEKKPMPVVINSNEGKTYQPIFTDKESIPEVKKFAHQGVICMPFTTLADVIIKQSVKVEGIVINFTSQNIIISKALLEEMLKFLEDKKAGKIEEGQKMDAKKIDAAGKSISLIKDGKVSTVSVNEVDPQTTIELKNPEIEELIENFHNTKSNEDLYKLVGKLNESRVLLPARMNEKKVPYPVTVTSPDGSIIQPVFTQKEHIPAEPKSEAVMNMPFEAVVNLVLTEGMSITGIGVNAFDKAVIIKKEYFEKLKSEAGGVPNTANIDPSKLNDKEYALYERARFELQCFPEIFFDKPEEVVKLIADKKECYIDELFEGKYEDIRRYPYLPEDFRVMVVNANETQKIVVINMPSVDMAAGVCHEIYLSIDTNGDFARYFAIVEGQVKGKKNLVEIIKGGQVKMYGNAPEEGTEINHILSL